LDLNEKEFTTILQSALQRELEDFEVLIGENLIYKVIINTHGDYQPKAPYEPKRGDFAFQTDLLVKHNNIPLVAIEVKYGRFTTHDILTYSTKALKHKEIYPYLRYGLLIGGTTIIYNRFFTHNAGFDFALAIENTGDENINYFLKIVKEQLDSAQKLLNILKIKNRTKLFHTKVITERI